MPVYSVLFVESGTAGGGSFESLYQHLRVINRQRFRPVVVYLNENRFVEPLKALGIPVNVLTDWLYSKRVPRYIRGALGRMALCIGKLVPVCSLNFVRLVHMPLVNSLKHIVREERIDIIHLNDQTNRDLFGLFVAERTGTICISHLRSMRSAGFDQPQAVYANRVVSAYIANSKMTKRYWVGKGIDANKTRLVYNAIPAIDIRPLNIRKTWTIDDAATFIIGCIAPLIEDKGHRFLLRAFAHFAERHPEAILMVVGDGRTRELLAQEARALEIDSRVIFTGFEERAKEIIASLDVSVVPSEYDSFGRVVLETMQAGTPLIATDVGGIREIVWHGHNGLLISYGNEEEFTKAMESLLTDKHLRSKLVENGYRTVRERFSIERYASEIEHIYESVLGQH